MNVCWEGCRFAQRLIALLLLREGDEGILHILLGGQYGLLISDEGLVAQRFLRADIGNDGAALQHGPGRRGTDARESLSACSVNRSRGSSGSSIEASAGSGSHSARGDLRFVHRGDSSGLQCEVRTDLV